MHEEFVSQRINLLLSDARLEWVRRCASIKSELSARGQFGGSVGYRMGINAFESILADAVKSALAEIGNGVPTRRKDWDWAHQLLITRMRENFSDVGKMCAEQLVRSPMDLTEGERLLERALKHAEATIAAHQIGWTAPPAKGWNERHPIQFAIGLLALGAVAGAAATKASDAIFPKVEVACPTIVHPNK